MLVPLTQHCYCNDRRVRGYIAPIRIYSTFADWLRRKLDLDPGTPIGTWQCARCSAIHPLTASHFNLATTCRISANPLK